MTKRHSLSIGRTALLASASLLFLGQGAIAADDTGATETVVVTGTRIPRPELDLPSPTITLSDQDLKNSGTTNLGDYLKRIPALVGSLGDYQTNGYGTPASNDGSSLGGLNLLDLRNLGYVRTLVLIDGKRVVASSTGSAAVDISTIPITLISDIQTSTSGQSSIYGADAVSGVVNFIMKHDLEGIHTRFQAGTSEDGGGSKYLAAVSVGHNFDDGKGNFSATFEGAYQDHLFFTQRKFTNVGGIQYFVTNPDNPDGSNPNLPANIPTNDAAFIFSALTGAIDTDLDGLPDRLGTGAPFILGTDIGNASAIGSSGTPYAIDLQGDFQPTERRFVTQFDGTYEFSRYFKVNADFRWAHVDTKSTATAPFDDITIISADNAFLPANVAALIAGNGLGLGTLAEDYQSIRNIEEVKRDTYRFVIDLSGEIPAPSFLDNIKYDLSYVYGETDIDDININNRLTDRFFAALDSVKDPVTGQPVCRSNLNPAAVPPDLSIFFGPDNAVFSDTTQNFFVPTDYPLSFTPGPNSGCVAFNPFGPTAASQAAINFVTAHTHTLGLLQQHVVGGYVSAEVPAFKDIGFAGPLAIVAGGEYRKESSSSNPDAILRGNNAWISGFNPVAGKFDVYEFYGEVNLPLVADVPLVKELSAEGSVRTSHYSTAGDSTSWTFGGIYSPFDFVKFRGSDAYAVRAPNIGELFAPNQQLFSFVTDPCDFTQVNLGTAFRPANCQAILDAVLGPGVYQPGVTVLTTGATTPVLIGGNTGLKPEAARTYTAGIVLQPPGWGLVATADWYDVRISNAIQALSGQTIASECVDLSSIDNPFCAQITRTPGGAFPGSISQIRAQEINVASFSTAGMDFTLNYSADTTDWFGTNYGTVNFHLIGNWLDHLTFQSLPNEAPVQGAGTIGGGFDGTPAPKWQANLDILWTMDKWSVDYNIDWYSHVLRTTLQTFKDQPNFVAKQFLFIPDRYVQDIQIGYDFAHGWNAYFGVNNLFYQKPAIGQSAYPVDPIGRFFYIGVKSDLDFGDVGL